MQIKSTITKKIYPIIILQSVSALILVITVLLIKFFGGDMFDTLNKAHSEYLEAETDVKSVIESPSIVSVDGKATVAAVPLNISENIISDNRFTLPLVGVLTSSYGYRSDPFTAKTKMHKGVDIAADKGTDIIAAAGGEVCFVGFDKNGFGNYLIIKHSDKLKTLYGHCDKILVSLGDKVVEGQVIAKVGSTGVATGDHLHFEIKLSDVAVNPEWYLSFGE